MTVAQEVLCSMGSPRRSSISSPVGCGEGYTVILSKNAFAVVA